MIKINLALKKQSATAGGGGEGGSKVLGARVARIDFRLDDLKDYPVKRVAVALGVCLAINFAFETYQEEELAKLDGELSKLRSEQSTLQAEIGKTRGYETLKQQMDADEAIMLGKIDTIEKLVADRETPPKLLLAIASATPPEVWLTSLRISERDLAVSGGSLGYNHISDFMKSLNENAYYTDLNLGNTQQSQEPQSNGADVATFDLTAKRR